MLWTQWKELVLKVMSRSSIGKERSKAYESNRIKQATHKISDHSCASLSNIIACISRRLESSYQLSPAGSGGPLATRITESKCLLGLAGSTKMARPSRNCKNYHCSHY